MTRSCTLGKPGRGAGAAATIALAGAWAIVVFAAPRPTLCAGKAREPERYVWRRQDDWTVRPDGEHGKADGNPDDDAKGRRVWSYEYYTDLPDDCGLDARDKHGPWFTRRTGGKMVWNRSWWGGKGAWTLADDMCPPIGQKAMSHVNSDTERARHSRVPVVRWCNLTGKKLTLRLTAGEGLCVKWAGTHARAWSCSIDLAIALVDASDGNRVIPIHTQRFRKPTDGSAFEKTYLRGLDIPAMRIDPGDQILITIRAVQQYRGGGARWVTLYDDITMAAATVRPARPATQPAKALTPGRMTELWALVRRGGDGADNALDELSLASDGAAARLVKTLRTTVPSRKRTERWIKQLDSDSWKQRVAATEALEREGPAIAGILADALAVAESLEVKQRLKLILAALAVKSAGAGRSALGLRTVLLFRRIGSSAAKAALKDLAGPASTPLVRHQAATALLDLSRTRKPRSQPATRRGMKNAD